MTRKTYGFEHALRAPWGAPADHKDRLYETFLTNLDLEREQLTPKDSGLLKSYVANVHINCRWFNRQVLREKLLQRLFFITGLVLLVLLPVLASDPALLFKALNLSPPSAKGGDTTATLTTALAILIALYRAVSSWLQQRKIIGPFWKARADLLDEIYSLETQWRHRIKLGKANSQSSLTPDFVSAIESSFNHARQLTKSAEQTFFDNYSLPSVDAPGLLAIGRTTVTDLLTQFELPSVRLRRAQYKAVQELSADVHKLTALADALGETRATALHQRDQVQDKNSPEYKEFDTLATNLTTKIATTTADLLAKREELVQAAATIQDQ